MLRVFPLLFILFFASVVDVSASTSGGDWSRWQEARTLYNAGKYEEAYQSLLAQPSEQDATYFYNLGTLSYRLGKSGAALGYFEKANRLRRHDPEIRHNLELVKSDLGRTLGPEKLDPASAWTETLADQVSLEEVRGVLGLMGLILALFWIRIYRKNRDIRQTLARPAALIGTAVLVVLAGLYWIEMAAQTRFAAVVLARQAIRSGPGESYSELSQVDAGGKVRLLGPSSQGVQPDGALSTENWLQVRYSGSSVGWVRASGVLVIN